MKQICFLRQKSILCSLSRHFNTIYVLINLPTTPIETCAQKMQISCRSRKWSSVCVCQNAWCFFPSHQSGDQRDFKRQNLYLVIKLPELKVWSRDMRFLSAFSKKWQEWQLDCTCLHQQLPVLPPSDADAYIWQQRMYTGDVPVFGYWKNRHDPNRQGDSVLFKWTFT